MSCPVSESAASGRGPSRGGYPSATFPTLTHRRLPVPSHMGLRVASLDICQDENPSKCNDLFLNTKGKKTLLGLIRCHLKLKGPLAPCLYSASSGSHGAWPTVPRSTYPPPSQPSFWSSLLRTLTSDPASLLPLIFHEPCAGLWPRPSCQYCAQVSSCWIWARVLAAALGSDQQQGIPIPAFFRTP